MSIPIDHVLMLRDDISRLVNCKLKVRHRVELLISAACTPEADRIESWLAYAISLVHDC